MVALTGNGEDCTDVFVSVCCSRGVRAGRPANPGGVGLILGGTKVSSDLDIGLSGGGLIIVNRNPQAMNTPSDNKKATKALLSNVKPPEIVSFYWIVPTVMVRVAFA